MCSKQSITVYQWMKDFGICVTLYDGLVKGWGSGGEIQRQTDRQTDRERERERAMGNTYSLHLKLNSSQ